MADTAGENAHQHFTGSRRIDRELFDHSWLTRHSRDHAPRALYLGHASSFQREDQ